MEKNEIKKQLYKEKPIAHRHVGNGDTSTFNYITNFSLGVVEFRVPITEMGETLFENKMPAQLLIRWML